MTIINQHNDDDAAITLTYTWGDIKEILADCGRLATDRNAEAVLAADEFVNPTVQMEDMGRVAMDDYLTGHVQQAGMLPDDAWYDRTNGEWVYNREKPADHHDEGENESWYGTACKFWNTSGLNPQERCCNTCVRCGVHMCENHTVRCCACGSVICNHDARETPEGEWECLQCANTQQE